MSAKRTAVLGASINRDRFSNRAVRSLLSGGHPVIPVHPIHTEIEGLRAVRDLGEISESIDTVTMYLRPQTGEGLIEAIRKLAPRRVIMNPGAESDRIESELRAAGIEVVRDCTLVMLSQNRF